MTRRLLDLFCGAGGCSVGYHRAGFDVVGVDRNPQPDYPFEFHQADAMTFPLDGFDAVHASPPCQAYTTMKEMPNAGRHPELLEPTREWLMASGLPWIMENVPGAPLMGVTLCGTMFSLNNGTYELRRHRLFESNVSLPQPSCRHRLPVVGFYGDHARTRQRTAGHRDRGGDIVGNERKMPLVRDLMGIDWMNWGCATQAIPPAYTEYVGGFLMLALAAEASA